MKRNKNGFTLIEVMLFLAVSGLLLAGIIAGTQNSISSQRFKDATQNFVEFLRSVYSEVANPQNLTGDGRSDYLVYGKLISFGLKCPLNTTVADDGCKGNTFTRQGIYVHDVVGKSDNIGSSSVVNELIAADANIMIQDGSVVKFVGAREYIPRWGAVIDGTTNGAPYRGHILIVRHPRSGTISTLVYDKSTGAESTGTVEVNYVPYEINSGKHAYYNVLDAMLTDGGGHFKAVARDFCVNPDGFQNKASVKRRDVRLIKDARNGSGVQLIDQDSADNKCKN